MVSDGGSNPSCDGSIFLKVGHGKVIYFVVVFLYRVEVPRNT